MGTWIKWWKSKFWWTVFGIAGFAIVASLLSMLFVVAPWNWIIMLVVVLTAGISLRKIITDKIMDYIDSQNKTNEVL
jgi:hypothetical protein